MENKEESIKNTSQKAGTTEISEYFRNLQKKSSISRLKNDPNTYKKMANIRYEKEREGELEIKVE